MTRALLCGTSYGSSYLPLLTDAETRPRLGGILSRGSERSRQFAQATGVPHHLSLDELKDGQVDVVIVAVAGEAGFRLALDSLKRGLHVLAEHPWDPAPLAEALALADRMGLCFHVNSHWGDLKNCRHFISGCQRARQDAPAVFASMISNPRTLYSGLDILRRALGSLEFTELDRLGPVAEDGTPRSSSTPRALVTLQGMIDGVLVTLQNQSFTSAVDDGTVALVNHHLVVGFPQGHLTLAEATGPAIWAPALVQLMSMGVVGLSQAAWVPLTPGHPPSAGDFVHAHRAEANRLALDQWLRHMEQGECPDAQLPAHLLEVSRTWARLNELTGPIAYVSAQNDRG